MEFKRREEEEEEERMSELSWMTRCFLNVMWNNGKRTLVGENFDPKP
jgi:hypothetical protein